MSTPVSEAPRVHDIPALLDWWADRRPDVEVLRIGTTGHTWAQLDRRVRSLATALRGAGVGEGDRVAVLDHNHPSCLELTLACARIGAANTVVNFRLASPEVAYVVNDAAAVMLFVGPEFTDLVDGVADRLPTVRRVVRVGGSADEYESLIAEHEPEAGPAAVDPESCFVQLYTSGTTGFPKGVMLTHRSMLNHSRNLAADYRMDGDSVVQVPMPLFHVGGTSYSFLALYRGARLVVLRKPEPPVMVEQWERERITHTFVVPALLSSVLQLPGILERDLSSIRMLSYGASPMPLPTMRACLPLFPGRMHQVYGMTEACGVISSLGPEDHDDAAVAHRLVSAGRPAPGCELEIRDPRTHEVLPAGVPGEIWMRSDQLMAGYWQFPEASRDALTPDGRLRTGDGGHLDEDGYLYITDRVKDMIISGGENVYPAEIERVLAEYPGVVDVAVVGVPDERWGEVPRAIVVAPGGVDEAAVLEHCRAHLASFKCPKGIDVVDELPRNPTGKILKKDLRAPFWAGRERRTV